MDRFDKLKLSDWLEEQGEFSAAERIRNNFEEGNVKKEEVPYIGRQFEIETVVITRPVNNVWHSDEDLYHNNEPIAWPWIELTFIILALLALALWRFLDGSQEGKMVMATIILGTIGFSMLGALIWIMAWADKKRESKNSTNKR